MANKAVFHDLLNNGQCFNVHRELRDYENPIETLDEDSLRTFYRMGRHGLIF